MEDALNDHVQEAIRRKDWGIVSVNLEDNPKDLNKETFKMLAGVFNDLSLKSIEKTLKKGSGRLGLNTRDKLMAWEYRRRLGTQPKSNTSPAQHKAQAREATARAFKISGRAFDKALERFIQKELLKARLITNGVDVKALFEVADAIDVGLEAEGLTPGTGYKLLKGLKTHQDVIERVKVKKRHEGSQ